MSARKCVPPSRPPAPPRLADLRGMRAPCRLPCWRCPCREDDGWRLALGSASTLRYMLAGSTSRANRWAPALVPLSSSSTTAPEPFQEARGWWPAHYRGPLHSSNSDSRRLGTFSSPRARRNIGPRHVRQGAPEGAVRFRRIGRGWAFSGSRCGARSRARSLARSPHPAIPRVARAPHGIA